MCPVSVSFNAPLARSQILIVRSALPVANHSFEGSTATLRTQPWCPLITRYSFQGARHSGRGHSDARRGMSDAENVSERGFLNAGATCDEAPTADRSVSFGGAKLRLSARVPPAVGRPSVRSAKSSSSSSSMASMRSATSEGFPPRRASAASASPGMTASAAAAAAAEEEEGGGAGAAAVVVAREGAGSTRVASRTAWYSSRICAEVRRGGGGGSVEVRWGAVGGGEKRRGCLGGSGRLLRGSRAHLHRHLQLHARLVRGRPRRERALEHLVRALHAAQRQFPDRPLRHGRVARGFRGRHRARRWTRVETTTARGAVRGRASSKWSAGERGGGKRGRAKGEFGGRQNPPPSAVIARRRFVWRCSLGAPRIVVVVARQQRTISPTGARGHLKNQGSSSNEPRASASGTSPRAFSPGFGTALARTTRRSRWRRTTATRSRRGARSASPFPARAIATSFLFGHPPRVSTPRERARTASTRRTDASPRAAATAPPDPSPPPPPRLRKGAR
jgi:hypothetical protein